MADRAPRRWIWIALMVAATAWYAWPQAIYSLLPIYDLLRFLFPSAFVGLQPWIDSLRRMTGR